MKRHRNDGKEPFLSSDPATSVVHSRDNLASTLPNCLTFVLVDEFKNADGARIGHLVKAEISLRNVKMTAGETVRCWICGITTLGEEDSEQVHVFVTPVVDNPPSQWISVIPFIGNVKLQWRTLLAQNNNDLMNTFVAFLYACFRHSGDINVAPKTLFSIDDESS